MAYQYVDTDPSAWHTMMATAHGFFSTIEMSAIESPFPQIENLQLPRGTVASTSGDSGAEMQLALAGMVQGGGVEATLLHFLGEINNGEMQQSDTSGDGQALASEEDLATRVKQSRAKYQAYSALTDAEKAEQDQDAMAAQTASVLQAMKRALPGGEPQPESPTKRRKIQALADLEFLEKEAMLEMRQGLKAIRLIKDVAKTAEEHMVKAADWLEKIQKLKQDLIA